MERLSSCIYTAICRQVLERAFLGSRIVVAASDSWLRNSSTHARSFQMSSGAKYQFNARRPPLGQMQQHGLRQPQEAEALSTRRTTTRDWRRNGSPSPSPGELGDNCGCFGLWREHIGRGSYSFRQLTNLPVSATRRRSPSDEADDIERPETNGQVTKHRWGACVGTPSLAR